MSAVSMRTISMKISDVEDEDSSESWVSAGQGKFMVTMVTSAGKIFTRNRVLGGGVGDSAVTSNDGTVVWFVAK